MKTVYLKFSNLNLPFPALPDEDTRQISIYIDPVLPAEGTAKNKTEHHSISRITTQTFELNFVDGDRQYINIVLEETSPATLEIATLLISLSLFTLNVTRSQTFTMRPSICGTVAPTVELNILVGNAGLNPFSRKATHSSGSLPSLPALEKPSSLNYRTDSCYSDSEGSVSIEIEMSSSSSDFDPNAVLSNSNSESDSESSSSSGNEHKLQSEPLAQPYKLRRTTDGPINAAAIAVMSYGASKGTRPRFISNRVFPIPDRIVAQGGRIDGRTAKSSRLDDVPKASNPESNESHHHHHKHRHHRHHHHHHHHHHHQHQHHHRHSSEEQHQIIHGRTLSPSDHRPQRGSSQSRVESGYNLFPKRRKLAGLNQLISPPIPHPPPPRASNNPPLNDDPKKKKI